MVLFQSFDDIKKNITHYALLFFAILLGIGLFVNFGFDYDGRLKFQGIRLILWSCLITLFPLIFLRNFFFRILSFVGLALLAFFFEARFGHYPDWAGLILIFLGIINAVIFLIALGIDYIKDKKYIRIILIIIVTILLVFSVFRIYKYTRIGYERRHSETIIPTALEKQDCGGITDSYLKYQCFTKLAVDTSNPDLCKNVDYYGHRLDCLKKTTTNLDYQRICSYFKDEEKWKCLSEIGAQSKTRGACLEIPKDARETSTHAFTLRDECLSSIDRYSDQNDNELSIEYCENYFKVDLCIYNLAKIKNDINLCFDNRLNMNDKDNCINEIAHKNFDAESCLKIENSYLKQTCSKFISIVKEAIEKKDPMACSFGRTGSVVDTENCILKLAVETQNADLCTQLNYFDSKLECVKKTIPSLNPDVACPPSTDRFKCLDNAIQNRAK